MEYEDVEMFDCICLVNTMYLFDWMQFKRY